MKDKKTGLIQALIGAVILIICIVLCVNTYIVKGNKAYAFSLLVTILGIVILIAWIKPVFLSFIIIFSPLIHIFSKE